MLTQAAASAIILTIWFAKAHQTEITQASKPTQQERLIPLVADLQSILPVWREAIERNHEEAENGCVKIFHKALASLNEVDRKRTLELIQSRDRTCNYVAIRRHYQRVYSDHL